jgi:hypothetical protein
MRRTTVVCLRPGNPHQATDARCRAPAVPWGKIRAVVAIGQAAGAMTRRPSCMHVRRLRFAEG